LAPHQGQCREPFACRHDIDASYPAAQRLVGEFFLRSIGVEASREEAINWLSLAADQSAANVARNVCDLGSAVEPIGFCGADTEGPELKAAAAHWPAWRPGRIESKVRSTIRRETRFVAVGTRPRETGSLRHAQTFP
jgi:hypothetical protein